LPRDRRLSPRRSSPPHQRGQTRMCRNHGVLTYDWTKNGGQVNRHVESATPLADVQGRRAHPEWLHVLSDSAYFNLKPQRIPRLSARLHMLASHGCGRQAMFNWFRRHCPDGVVQSLAHFASARRVETRALLGISQEVLYQVGTMSRTPPHSQKLKRLIPRTLLFARFLLPFPFWD